MELNDDVLLEIISHLDLISTIRVIRVSSRFWNLKGNITVTTKLSPFKTFIKYKQWNKALVEAVKRSDIDLINFLINRKGANNFNEGLNAASSIGSVRLVEYFLELGADSFVDALAQSSRHGHKHLVEFFMNKIAPSTDIQLAYRESLLGGHLEIAKYFRPKIGRFKPSFDPLSVGAEGGHQVIIDWLLDQGCNRWSVALIGAARGGRLDLVEFFWNKGGTKYASHALNSGAAKSGKKEIVEWLLSKGVEPDWNQAMNYATYGRQHEMILYCIQKGASNWNDALSNAAAIGDLELVKFFIDKGAQNLDEALEFACSDDHRETIEFLIEKGATDLNPNLDNAAKRGHTSLVEFLLEKGATFDSKQ